MLKESYISNWRNLPEDAVRVFMKLGIRIYVPDDVYANTRRVLKGFSRDELERLRKFSQIFEDLRPFATPVQKRLDGLE